MTDILQKPIEENFRLNPKQKSGLKKFGLNTYGDILNFFPIRYEKTLTQKPINGLQKEDEVSVYGRLSNLETGKTWSGKRPFSRGTLVDPTGKIKILWLNQPYLAKMFAGNPLVKISGKVSERKNTLCFVNPTIDKITEIPLPILNQDSENQDKNPFEPIYKETTGLSSRWFYFAVQKILRSGILEEQKDPIPSEILKKYNLPSLKSSLVWIHIPKKEGDYLAARKRFAFQEIFFIQLEKQKERKASQEKKSFKIEKTKKDLEKILKKLPFRLTEAQNRAVSEILRDFKREFPMSRLLEGDVGSGKTAVAAIASYATISTPPPDNKFGGLQVAYMAPTEILANQHFKTFIEIFSGLGIKVGLLTGSGCKKFPSKINPKEATTISKSQLLKWVANGEIPILIGTHSLIEKNVNFKNLAFVIIDEQHRFGVRQRAQLAARGRDADKNATRINAEEIDPLLFRDLTYTIRNIAFTIHKELGSGHKEQVYQRAFKEELIARGLKFNMEKQIDVKYRNKKIGVYQPDFIVDDKVLLEIKALKYIGPKEKKQAWHYIKNSPYKVALLINFGTEKVQIERIVYDVARNPRSSASTPRESAQQMRSLPHLLSMTATPIPRTLALTIYGDLDLTILDQMPSGRKPVITEIVTPQKRKETYEKIRHELVAGRQLYVVCPRINEPDPEKEMALNVKSVTEEAKRLKKEIFPEYEIGILHSKLKKDEKEKVMDKFTKNEIQILCATSVVEVGVNVPNATTIIIEGAERFGLAQLHQLRGRVLRSRHQAYCFVFSDSKSGKSIERLKAMITAKNGFELAELDLVQRGAGELYGQKQWGITDLGMEAIKNIKMVEAARNEAREIVESDPEFKEQKHQHLREILENQKGKYHFE